MTRRTRPTLLALLLALAMALSSMLAGASPATAASAAAAKAEPLTNLAHINWLGATVRPPKQAHHTTYQLAKHPRIGVLWTYAEQDAGVWKRVGGGAYDAATNTWGQGAFNADDISRAAVVYTRHWQLTGKKSSRKHARQLLRGLTYLQTATGANRGNVVLWMQPDGTLNRSADPVELPDPSDSDAAYWTARTIWALGEGYAAFRDVDPKFAAFLRARLVLSMHAIDRQVLDKYGTYTSLHGVPTPAWLIADGGDATSEAMLGLAAYVDAGGGHAARSTLRRLANGVAKLGGGNARTWPNGALLPWAGSRSIWHAWGANMPSGLARAGAALGDRSLVKPAIRDAATFTPYLLTSGGPDQARLPSRIDATQIAYGADARVQGLFATATAAHRPGLRKVAGVAAAWFFGANLSHKPAYDPATGRTIDGVEKDGRVNPNSGAESTIHGLLDDARPRRAPEDRQDRPHRRHPRAGGHDDVAGRGRGVDGRGDRRRPHVDVDGRVAVRRHWLRRARQRRCRHGHRATRAGPRRRPAGGQPGARELGGHHGAHQHRHADRSVLVRRRRRPGRGDHTRRAAPGDPADHPVLDRDHSGRENGGERLGHGDHRRVPARARRVALCPGQGQARDRAVAQCRHVHRPARRDGARARTARGRGL